MGQARGLSRPWAWLGDQIVIVGVGCCGGARSQIEFCEDVAEMARDGLLADVKLVRDLAVRDAGGDEFKNLQFPGGQRAYRLAPRQQQIHTSNIGCGTECFKLLTRSSKFLSGILFFAEAATRKRDQHLHASSFVRRLELKPDGP